MRSCSRQLPARLGTLLAQVALTALLAHGCSDDLSTATPPTTAGGAGGTMPPAATPTAGTAAASAGSGTSAGAAGRTATPPAAGAGGVSATAGSDSGQPTVPVAGAGGAAAAPDAGPAEQPDAMPPGPDAATPDKPITCPTMKMAAGDHDGSVEAGGRTRTYLLHVPRSYMGDKPVPLVFDFHGYSQPVRSQMGASGFAQLADKHGFVTVYPAGVGGSWHVNGCCGQAAQEKIDEIESVRAILTKLSTQVCVDPKRVYASGISQGGGMAHHVGCLAADIFAAVAPVSSDLRTDPCKPVRPISELSFRGTADTLSAYEGGPVGPAGMQYQSIGAKPTLDRWKTIDGCTGTPEKVRDVCETYKQCSGGVEVTLCSIPGGGHALYTNPQSFPLAEFAWEMFERQHLP